MMAAIASHRPIDAAEPLAKVHGAFVCAPAALSSWAMASAAGQRCIYARAPRLSGHLAERARLLARCGALQINQARNGNDRDLFDFIAIRTAKPIAADAGMIERLPQRVIDVLEVLERCAARQMSCPSNSQIASTLLDISAPMVGHAIAQLRAVGLVDVTSVNRGGNQYRTITIVATGERLLPAGVMAHG